MGVGVLDRDAPPLRNRSCGGVGKAGGSGVRPQSLLGEATAASPRRARTSRTSVSILPGKRGREEEEEIALHVLFGFTPPPSIPIATRVVVRDESDNNIN